MSKLLEMWEASHNAEERNMYRSVPSVASDIPVKPEGSGHEHPLRYVYPDDGIQDHDSIVTDEVLSQNSVSLGRDVSRMNIFGRSRYGTRFLDRQKQLQKENTWGQTRLYDEDNIKNNTEDPVSHKPRHIVPLRSQFGGEFNLPGEFAVKGNTGKLQVETSQNLIASPSPVHFRMISKEGILNAPGTGYELVGIVLDSYKGDLVNILEDKLGLAKANKKLSALRGTYTDTTVVDRPELRFRYLDQIYQANMGVKSLNTATDIITYENGTSTSLPRYKFGHIYLDLEENPERGFTYENVMGRRSGADLEDYEGPIAPGFKSERQLSPDALKEVSHRVILSNLNAHRFVNLYDSVLGMVERAVGNAMVTQAQSVVGSLFGSDSSIGQYLSDPRRLRHLGKHIPTFNDFDVTETVRGWLFDIDEWIAEWNALLYAVFGDNPRRIELAPTKLTVRYGADRTKGSPSYNVATVVGGGARSSAISRYRKAVGEYKAGLGFSVEGGNAQDVLNDIRSAYAGNVGTFKALPERVEDIDDIKYWSQEKLRARRYYKDPMQLDSLNIEHGMQVLPEEHTDYIDVVFEVVGKGVYSGTGAGGGALNPLASAVLGAAGGLVGLDGGNRASGTSAASRPTINRGAVRFRAFIEDVGETVTPSYIENKYIGRHETFYTYDRVVRDLTFKLTLHAFSEEEIQHIMRKMAYLTSLAYPENFDNYLTPLVTKLTIGKLYRGQPCILQTLSHTVDQDVSWDLDQGVPMTVLSNIGVRLLDKRLYTNSDMKIDAFNLYLNDEHAPRPRLQSSKGFEGEMASGFAGPRASHDPFGYPLPGQEHLGFRSPHPDAG